MAPSNVISDPFKFVDKKSDVLGRNPLNNLDPSVSQTKVISNAAASGKGFTNLYDPKIVRNVDELRMQSIRNYASKSDYSNAILQGLRIIQDDIGNINGVGELPKIPDSVSNFFLQANYALQDIASSENKNLFVSSATTLCTTLNQTAQSCYNQKHNTQLQIAHGINELNQALEGLAELNLYINRVSLNEGDITRLQDERDRYLTTICSYIYVETPRYSYTKDNQTAAVMLTAQGTTLVNNEGSYAQFEFTADDPQNISSGSDLPQIIVRQKALKNSPAAKAYNQNSDAKVFYDPNNPQDLPNGVLKGMIDLHEKELPAYIGCLDSLAFNLTEQINKIHNSGSSFLGRTEIKGNSSTSLLSRSLWSGSTRIAVVNEDGTPAMAGSNPISPLTLNLEKLSQIYGGGVTIQNILTEINSFFGSSLTTQVGMGQQDTGDNSEKYLLNDVKMVVSKTTENQINFDFEGINTSDFGGNFEVLSVSSPAGSSVISSLPQVARIERGEKTRTYQSVVLNKGSLTGMQTVNVTFRVKGDNGVVNEGTLSFDLDFTNTIEPGTRLAATLPLGAGVGDFSTLSLDWPELLNASLVDSNGFDISDNKEGYVSISALNAPGSSNYKIVIQDDDSSTISDDNQGGQIRGFEPTYRGLSHFLGLNNFFDVTEEKGQYALTMQVRPDIADAPDLLSISRLMAQGTMSVDVTVGDSFAQGSVAFTPYSAGVIDITSYAGSNISIMKTELVGGVPTVVSTQTYSLVNGPTSTFNQINIAGSTSAQQIITKIATYLNSTTYCSNYISFAQDGNALSISAAQAGSSGNNIAFKFQSGGAAIYDGASDTGTKNLAGGSDTLKTQELPVLGMMLASSDTDILAEICDLENNSTITKNDYINLSGGGLLNLASYITTVMVTKYDTLDRNYRVERSALDSAITDYKHVYGFDRNQHSLEVLALANYMQQVSFAQAKLFQIYQDSIRILFGH